MSTSGPPIGKLEPYLSMAEIADWLQRVTGSKKWTANMVREHLRREAPEALFPMAGSGSEGRRWHTTRDMLRRAFARVWDELYLKEIEVEVDGDG